MQWIMTHIGDIVVLGILGAMAGLIIYSIVKNKGKCSGCSGSCGSCSGCSSCHSCTSK